MVSVLTSRCGRSWVRAGSDQTKEYRIDICCLSDKHATLRSKSKDGAGS
jgi:hypothetical protein